MVASDARNGVGLTGVALSLAVLVSGCRLAEPPAAALQPTPAQATLVEKLDVLTALGKARGFTTVARLIRAAGLDATLTHDGPWTILAPSDEAFARLPEGTLDALLAPEGKEALVALVKNHVLEGRLDSDELRKRGRVETLGGQPLSVVSEGSRLRVEGALLEAIDLDARNGIAHAVEGVLMPRSTKPET